MYGYLCVQGGFVLPQALNSCSTDLRAEIGGIEGRCLQAGDQLQTANDHILRSEIGIAPIPLRDVIRALPSSEYQAFKRKSQYYWWRNEWTLQSNSDRMGYRFQGQTLELKQPLEMLSHAIQFGSVQVPPSAQPIILMADAQTTGGYPKIANVIDADLGALAQVRLGSTIKFEAVSLQEAAKLRRKNEIYLDQIRRIVDEKIDLNADIAEGFPFDESLLQLLSSANIACGLHAGVQRKCKVRSNLRKKIRCVLVRILVFLIAKILVVRQWRCLHRN